MPDESVKYIVENSIKKLENNTGFKTMFEYNQRAGSEDGMLEIGNSEFRVKFNVVIKLFVNKIKLGMIISQMSGVKETSLLITTYMNPKLIEMAEDNNINFIDAAGNALIKVFPLFIKVKGNKSVETGKLRTPQKEFSIGALQTIFALLCNPGLEEKSVREIVKQSGATIGTVYRTLKSLEAKGYLVKHANMINKVINRADLLKQWVTLYPDILREKYLIGRYEGNEINNELHLDRFNALYGGEEAAATLTKYLRPFIRTIYISGKQGEFILRNRLKMNPNGNLILMKKFWNFENNEYAGLTHPILVYADLLATGDSRNIETAEIIYGTYIARYIKEN